MKRKIRIEELNLKCAEPLLFVNGFREGFGYCVNPGTGIVLLIQLFLDVLNGGSPFVIGGELWKGCFGDAGVFPDFPVLFLGLGGGGGGGGDKESASRRRCGGFGGGGEWGGEEGGGKREVKGGRHCCW